MTRYLHPVAPLLKGQGEMTPLSSAFYPTHNMKSFCDEHTQSSASGLRYHLSAISLFFPIFCIIAFALFMLIFCGLSSVFFVNAGNIRFSFERKGSLRLPLVSRIVFLIWFCKSRWLFFKSGDTPCQGCVNKFSGGSDPLHALQHGKFFKRGSISSNLLI